MLRDNLEEEMKKADQENKEVKIKVQVIVDGKVKEEEEGQMLAGTLMKKHGCEDENCVVPVPMVLGKFNVRDLTLAKYTADEEIDSVIKTKRNPFLSMLENL